MVQYIPPIDPQGLLPPLLACLPTAFVSQRPPPALLPLLSPILRQRVQLLSATTTHLSDSWLPLLCWEPAQSSRLAEIVENCALEPHPVSGEIEYGDIDTVKYRRLDEETLQSRVTLLDLGLTILYLWCQGDQEGGGSGWRVSDLCSAETVTPLRAFSWWNSIGEADEHMGGLAPANSYEQETQTATDCGVAHQEEGPANADDDYWAQYDNTPSRTPAIIHSSALAGDPNTMHHVRGTSDAEYYSQYAQVQPAMDNHDPSEESELVGPSTLNGNAIAAVTSRFEVERSIGVPARAALTGPPVLEAIVLTRPSSSSSSSEAVARLEDSAASQSIAEVAIQQHISISLKSLFRLALGSGIERVEFERLVKTELDTLGLMTEDD